LKKTYIDEQEAAKECLEQSTSGKSESLLRYLYIRASIEGNWNRFHVRWFAFR
jgi:hypothetical protein